MTLQQMFASDITRKQKRAEVRKEAGPGPGWAGGWRGLGRPGRTRCHRARTIKSSHAPPRGASL